MFLPASHQFSLGTIAPTSPFAIEVGYLLVGGGGNGGVGAIDRNPAFSSRIIAGGGGGGGGQCLYGFINLQKNTTYPINICLDGSNASRGQTTFAGLTALTGGKGGGTPGATPNYDGEDVVGGGGGGGGFSIGDSPSYTYPVRSGSPGNLSTFNATKGSYGSSSLQGAGGGGAGGVIGVNGNPSRAREPGESGTNTAGWGSPPAVFTIANYTIIVGAGGGGATLYQQSNRGQGGYYNYTTKYGGDGGYFSQFGTPQNSAYRIAATNAPFANSGSGGGGAAGEDAIPGYGSSGRVVIFYRGAARASVSGVNQTTNVGAQYTVHFFYANGTISFSS